MPPTPRILLAHDWLCGLRGGELVLDHLLRIVAARAALAGLLVMVDDGAPLTPAIDAVPRTTSFLNRLPGGPGPLRRWLLPVYPFAVAHLSRRLARLHASQPIDLVISTSSAAIKALHPPPGVPHLCYCHSPARYAWDQLDDYAAAEGEGLLGPLRAAALRAYAPVYRRWDRRTAPRVTRFVANSTHTAARIRAAYARESAVIHPPVDTDFFTPPTSPAPDDLPPQAPAPFLLFAGALEPYKRADLAVRAAATLNTPLIVVGSGSQALPLRALAADLRAPVTFLGRVPRERLRELFRAADALLFPQTEDFGITAVEALACGTPVVARRSGGALDFIDDARTGAFFDHPTTDSLAAAVLSARALTALPAREHTRVDCRAAALRFAPDRFAAAINAQLDALLDGSIDDPLPSS